MVHVRRLFITLLSGVVLVAAGCSPLPTYEAPPGPAFPGAAFLGDIEQISWPHFARIDAADIAGLDTASFSDDDARAHAVVPQLHGHEKFNTYLKEWAGQIIADFPHESGTGPGVAETWLSTTWEITAISQDIVGIVLSAASSPGRATPDVHAAVWYSPASQEVVDWREFLTESARGQLPAAIAERLALVPAPIGRGEVDAAAFAGPLEAGKAAVGFSAEGNLVVKTDGAAGGEAVLSGGFGSPAVEFTPEQTAQWLTPTGRLAQHATLAPDLGAMPLPVPEYEGEISAAPSGPVGVPGAPEVDCSVARCVALTFDDGPGGRSTPELLRILRKAEVPATFFMVGIQIEAFPDIVAAVHQGGHEIGNHSWNHPSLTHLEPADIRKQLRRTNQALEQITGEKVTLMRPPYGATNGRVAKAAKAEGLAQILWNIDTLDWEHRNPKRTLAQAVKAQPGGVVLMHDIYAETVEAVPPMITKLREAGFEFVTVSQLLGDLEPGKVYYSGAR